MASQETQSRSQNEGCKDCNDNQNLTQKSINKERVKICDALYESGGKTFGLQEKFNGENLILDEKKCLFNKTHDNYLRYRNMDIVVGTELLQTNESVKANVASYGKTNKDLYAALKNIAKSIKDVKAKFDEFKQVTGKLDDSRHDPCNAAQWKALTGKGGAGCSDQEPIEPCKSAYKIFHELVCRPKGLMGDVNSLFNSSHDVVGIQMFTSVDRLEEMQKLLDEKSKAFALHIADVSKKRAEDIKKLQEELVKSVQEVTKAAVDRNHERSNFEGYRNAAKFLCCPPCDCITDWPKKEECKPDDKGYCDRIGIPLLGNCEKKITEVCKQVKLGFCCPEVTVEPGQPTNPCTQSA